MAPALINAMLNVLAVLQFCVGSLAADLRVIDYSKPGYQGTLGDFRNESMNLEALKYPGHEEFQAALASNPTGYYLPPADTPLYVIEGNYSIGEGLVARGGQAGLNYYSQLDCDGGFIGSVNRFGCPDPPLCVTWSTCAVSFDLFQSQLGGSYPTATIYQSDNCEGNYFSIGIGNNAHEYLSCTNAGCGCCSYSAIPYYKCG